MISMMSSQQDQFLAVVRKSIIGCNASNLLDSDVKLFIDFIKSDDTGVVILDDLLDADQRSLSLDEDGLGLIFKCQTPATTDLDFLFKYCRFQLEAPDIEKRVVAHLKAHPPNKSPEHSDGTLYYNNVKDLTGNCGVSVSGSKQRLTARFYRNKGCFALFQGDVVTSQDVGSFFADGNGEWEDSKDRKKPINQN